MKNIAFLLSFFFVLGIAGTASAQCQGKASASASKSCCMAKAAKAASSDASIERRVADNGQVSYVRKESDSSGNARFVSVRFDEKTNTFVNAAPKSANGSATVGYTKKKASCSSAEKKACAGMAGKKACCAGKSSGKACAGKAKASSSTSVIEQ